MLAYFESLAGIIPCRIIGVTAENWRDKRFNIKLTASRGPHQRGEVIRDVPLYRVIPRDKLRQRHHCIITLPYDWRDYGFFAM